MFNHQGYCNPNKIFATIWLLYYEHNKNIWLLLQHYEIQINQLIIWTRIHCIWTMKFWHYISCSDKLYFQQTVQFLYRRHHFGTKLRAGCCVSLWWLCKVWIWSIGNCKDCYETRVCLDRCDKEMLLQTISSSLWLQCLQLVMIDFF